jgi:hypothetical protein
MGYRVQLRLNVVQGIRAHEGYRLGLASQRIPRRVAERGKCGMGIGGTGAGCH